jgi:hypothetical protein
MVTPKSVAEIPSATERIRQRRLPLTYPDADTPAPETIVREIADETLPLVGAVPFYGPPVVLVAAPWLFLSLLLAGPFALFVTIVGLLAVVVALVAVVGAMLAAPVLLVRHLRVPAVTTCARLRSWLVHERPARAQEG